MLEPVLVVRGRHVYPNDIVVMQSAIDSHQEQGLDAIALSLCETWVWRSGGGRYNVRGAVRVLLAAAYRGLIQLPPQRRSIRVAARDSGTCEALDVSPVEAPLSEVLPLELILVTGGEEASLFHYLLTTYHYLGDRRTIGQHLKYLALSGGRPVAALLWGRAALKIRARDVLIGWSPAERRAGIERVANNYRFLVLPWVRVHNLASHVLAANVRTLPSDWKRVFGGELEYLESFVDPERFDGSCYLAANWLYAGDTSGSGRCGARYEYHGHRKKVMLYAIRPTERSLWSNRLQSQPIVKDSPTSRRHVVLPQSDGCTEGELQMLVETHKDSRGILDCTDVEALASQLSMYCDRYYDLFTRSELRGHFELNISGLLSPLEKKNLEFMALRGGTNVKVRTLQNFLTGSRWDDEAVRIRHQQFVATALGHPEGLYLVDESSCPKKGKDSAGVARQYCGSLGKVDNCQVGVYVAYANPNGGAELVDTRLYVPQSWFEDEDRKQKWESCHIPEDLEFRTKPELAAEMVQALHSRNVLTAGWVLADAVYGDNALFLDSLPEGLRHFCQVSCTTRVWLPIDEGGTTMQSKPIAVKDVFGELSLQWRTNVILKEGSQGCIFADVAACRVVEARTVEEADKKRKQQVRGKDVWLFLRRLPETGEVKYYLSNAPADTPLEKLMWLSCMRWPIETCFQEGKDHLGMDHYQVRTWRAWHRHMTLVMLAQHFLNTVRNGLKKKALD